MGSLGADCEMGRGQRVVYELGIGVEVALRMLSQGEGWNKMVGRDGDRDGLLEVLSTLGSEGLGTLALRLEGGGGKGEEGDG